MLLGLAGNDKEGELAVSSLQSAGIDVSNVFIEEKHTNVMNIIIPSNKLNDNSVLHSWYSPTDMTFTMNFSSNLPKILPEKLNNFEIYLILDKFLPINLDFLKSIKNKKVCLDVGHIRFFEHFTKQYLINFFKYADFIVINSECLNLLLERLTVRNEIELFELLNLNFLVITKGKNGANFVYRDTNGEIDLVEKVPETIVTPIDTTGAGDAFFSTLLKAYAYCDKIDKDFIDTSFSLANKASREVLMQLGSRRNV